IMKLGLPGIDTLDSTRRSYPNGPLAPQVIGFDDVDGTGIDGLELQYEHVLQGRAGRRVFEIDPAGHLIPQGVNHDVPPVQGTDVVTTIDKELQYRAQLALQAAVEGNRAQGGSLIVMDPRTGNVLAVARDP